MKPQIATNIDGLEVIQIPQPTPEPITYTQADIQEKLDSLDKKAAMFAQGLNEVSAERAVWQGYLDQFPVDAQPIDPQPLPVAEVAV